MKYLTFDVWFPFQPERMERLSNICYKCFVCTWRTLFPGHWARSGKSKVFPRIWKYFQKASTLIAIEKQNMKRWTGKQKIIQLQRINILWFQHFSFWSGTCCSWECEESLFIRGQIWKTAQLLIEAAAKNSQSLGQKLKTCQIWCAVTKVLRTSDTEHCQSGFLALTYIYTSINILLVLSQSETTEVSHSCIGKAWKNPEILRSGWP